MRKLALTLVLTLMAGCAAPVPLTAVLSTDNGKTGTVDLAQEGYSPADDSRGGASQVTLQCPNCGSAIPMSVRDMLLGKRITCPSCEVGISSRLQ